MQHRLTYMVLLFLPQMLLLMLLMLMLLVLMMLLPFSFSFDRPPFWCDSNPLPIGNFLGFARFLPPLLPFYFALLNFLARF